jgi:RNA polymerase sigma-70 factor, ECF subfamily
MVTHSEFLKQLLDCQDDIRAFLASLVRNCQDREDLFQETVLTIWDKFGEYDRSRPFGAWARGIAVNKVLQYRHRIGSAPTPFSPQVIAVIVEAFQRHEMARSDALDALEKCTEPLPEESRQLLVLRYVDGWPLAKIAERMGSTPSAMSKTLTRLRAKLYECVQNRLGRAKQEKAQ